ncbi:MAG: DUF3833 domain-containing protein [Gammaproteobacteria bacterium]
MSALRLAGLLLAIVTLLGCSSTSVRDYANREPRLDLQEYFDGPLVAWGIVQDRSGEVTRSFRVDLVGRWDGDTGVLEEDFAWSDGELERRVWHFRKLDEHRYTGTAGDVVGEASGSAYGNALHWRYTLALPWNDGTINVLLDDWMWLIQDNILVNRSEIRKFGFRVGEVTIFFQKPGNPDAT